MLSYVCDFNLKVTGGEAEQYLTTVLREWPVLYDELPGVQGILFLANAFALAGDYTYSYRLDTTSISTLKAFDAAVKSDDKRWQKARAEWFEMRSGVRARLIRHHSGDRDFCQGSFTGRGDQVVFTLSYRSGAGVRQVRVPTELRTELNKVWGAIDGVRTLQHHTAAVLPNTGRLFETWARLADLDTLDQVIEGNSVNGLHQLLQRAQATSHLYGVLREVDGALLSGA